MARSRNCFTLLASALLLVACGNGVEVTDLGKLEKPAQHDAAAQAVQAPEPVVRKVVVTEEVAKSFSGVKLSMKRRAEVKPNEFSQTLGETRTVDGVTLTVRDYLPSFYMDQDAIRSEGSEENNPAVWVEAREGEKLLFNGWLFRDYPELTPPVEEGFELRLVAAVKRK